MRIPRIVVPINMSGSDSISDYENESEDDVESFDLLPPSAGDPFRDSSSSLRPPSSPPPDDSIVEFKLENLCCHKCSYSLRGLPQNGKCPECGTPFEHSLCCRGCSYSLRGLSTDGNCPECGTPIVKSLQRDTLRFSNPDWLQQLATGFKWKLIAIAGQIIAVVLAFLFGGLSTATFLVGFIGTALAILSAVGTWYIVAPETGNELFNQSTSTMRIIVKVGAGFAILNALTSTLSPGLGILTGTGGGHFVIIALTFIGVCFATVASFVFLYYLRRLADRLVDERLYAETSLFLKVLYYGIAIIIIFAVLGTTAAYFSMGGLVAISAVIPMCFGIVFYIVVAIWWIGLLIRYRRAVAGELTIAKNQHWGDSIPSTV